MTSQRTKVQQELSSIRDTVESIWIAIVLAFVLRAFVVEAFVIPTGSMAPRLLGEHLEVRCPSCGYEYAFGWAHDGQEDDSRFGRSRRNQGKEAPQGSRCPSCGYDPRYDASAEQFPSGGDRVLVSKYLYRFRDPRPWDVIVFKNPQDNSQNYIKRLIGLPGETIELVHGDVFVDANDGRGFQVRRKSNPRTQEAMWQVVYDNDYRPNLALFDQYNARSDRAKLSPPPAWKPAEASDRQWDFSRQGGRVFSFAPAGGGAAAESVLALHADREAFLPNYGYNRANVNYDRETDIVSDLKLGVVFVPLEERCRVALELSSFEHVFRGELGADGTARLLCRLASSTAWTSWGATRLAKLDLGRGRQVSLTNVDLRLTLWVDGQAVLESADRDPNQPGDPGRYPLSYADVKARMAKAAPSEEGGASTSESPLPIPTPQVRIAVADGQCRLEHIGLFRDVYYTSPRITDVKGQFARDLGVGIGQKNGRALYPKGWGVTGNPITLWKLPGHPDLDQFFVLGDNSPSSLDGRLWTLAAPTLRLYDPPDSAGDPAMAVGDVAAWETFVAEVRRQAALPAPSPGKRLWSMLGEPMRRSLSDLGNQALPHDLAADLVDEINAIFRGGKFHDAEAWRGARGKLTGEAAALAARKAQGAALSDHERMELGRAALEAAFGEQVLKRRRVYQLGTVPRYSLIGKAVFVYWPSGFSPPGLSVLPIIPNVGKMRLIR